jgi:hypothetical protein
MRVAAKPDDPPGLVIGYAHLAEPALVRAISALAAAVRGA